MAEDPKDPNLTLECPQVLNIARGGRAGQSEKVVDGVRRYLSQEIKMLILNNTNQEIDPENPGTADHPISLNHTMLFFTLSQGQARFSMETYEDDVVGREVQGTFFAKFTSHQGVSNKKGVSVLHTDLPWDSRRGIRTLQELILTMGSLNLGEYMMTPKHHGCRHHSKQILSLLVQARMTDLNIDNDRLRWMKDTRVTDPLEISMQRLEIYFKYYFNIAGQPTQVAPQEGKFLKRFPSASEFQRFVLQNLPGLVRRLN